MQVKTITTLMTRLGPMQPGWTFEAESSNQFYLVKEGFFKGAKVHKHACEVTYTEKEWNDLENYYMGLLEKEWEQGKTLEKLINNLTSQNRLKNKEIEKLNFCINALAGALKLACEGVHKLKESEKAK